MIHPVIKAEFVMWIFGVGWITVMYAAFAATLSIKSQDKRVCSALLIIMAGALLMVAFFAAMTTCREYWV